MAIPTSEDKAAFSAIWSMVLEELSKKLSIPTFQLWMESTELAYLDAKTAVVVTDRDFKRDIIEERFFSTVSEILESVAGYPVTMYILSSERGEPDLSLFTAHPEPQDEFYADTDTATGIATGTGADSGTPEGDHAAPSPRYKREASLLMPGGDYTFENYIVGESNKFAQAASYAVAHDPGNAYNPLFIYGGSGLGKTHLLYSIMNEIQKNDPSLRIIYVKGEEFTNELVDSLVLKNPTTFRQKYRSADVLLIDDIQFIAGKDSIQEEFFHTFNALYEDHKQIILAADKPPRDMKQLEMRLRTRFEWGLLADVQPPSYELRVAILKTKAQNIGITLPKEILSYLANNLRSNIRQLEGAVKKIAAQSFISGDPPTLQMAKVCISELLGSDDPTPVKAEKIIAKVAAKYGVPPEDIRSRKRTGDVAMARHICIYLIHQSTDMTYGAIGDLFGRDRTTVMSSIDVVKAEMEQNPQFEMEVAELGKSS